MIRHFPNPRRERIDAFADMHKRRWSSPQLPWPDAALTNRHIWLTLQIVNLG